jgi:hypothetical protein
MTQERKAILYLVKENRNKVLNITEVKLRGQEATVADLKAAGYEKLFDAEKYTVEKEEVTCYKSNVTITDETLVSEERFFEYHLYVKEK